jgi:inositol-pentakisphosphate 2-kinase
MHSRLKQANGESIAPGYCPLDLFSPRQDRVRKAVSTLWNAWKASNASTNNLRIFLDGNRVAPDVSSFQFDLSSV